MTDGRFSRTARSVIQLVPLLLLAAVGLPAQSVPAQSGFDHFYNLEYEAAIADFEQAIAKSPDDPALHNHLAQSILFEEMFRNGALESELVSGTNSFLRRPKLNPSAQTEAQFLGEVQKAISLGEARLRKNPRDTTALYDLGISFGLRSNYYWVVKKAWKDSLRDATSARRYHNRISELEPGNVDARLVQGLHDYIVGSLPWTYRMLGFLVGIHGDKEKGIRTVQEVAAKGNLNRIDAEFFLCALYRRENQPLRAVPLVQDLIRRFPRNYLLRLELSQMYSVAGDKAHALEALDDLERMKTRNEPGSARIPWEKIYFQRGTIQFWYRDFDQALENLKRVAARSEEVDLNTGSYALLRIGQLHDLAGRRAEALAAYRKTIEYAPQSEAAGEAKKYLAAPYRRS